MPENLVKTPWEERSALPGFGYAGGVQDILSAYNGLHHRKAEVRYNNQVLMQQQIAYLQELKAVLETQENEFFDMFGLQGKNKKEKFLALKERIRAWDATGAGALITDSSVGNQFWTGLSILRKEAVRAEISQEDWENMLHSVLISTNGDEIKQMLSASPDLNIAQILNSILDKKAFSSNAKSSLVGNLTVTLDVDNNIKIQCNRGNITPNMQLKLKKELENYFKKQGQKRKPDYNFKAAFEELFAALPINATGIRYIRMALKDYYGVLEYYAFSSNNSQIKGFLGEVYNNAFLLYMADGNTARKDAIERITPTGMVLNQKGQEIIIDTWLKGFGIQVKNYEKNKTLKRGFNVHRTYNAGDFIVDVLQLPTGVGTSNNASVGDILLNLFTALDYNQDYGKTDPAAVSETDAYKFFRKTRSEMHRQLENTQNFTFSLMPYVAKILGVDRSFSSKESIFVEEKVYHNTFFNISGNYIPSSHIVQSIIDSLEKRSQEDSLTSFVEASFSTKHSLSGEVKWTPYVTNNTVEEVYGKRLNYVNASTISYSISLNISKLIDNITYF